MSVTSGGQAWTAIGTASIDDNVLGVGDFGADGSMDLAFRQNGTGVRAFMSVNPTGGEAWHQIPGTAGVTYASVGGP